MSLSPAATGTDQGRFDASVETRRSRGRVAGLAVAAILAVAFVVHVYWALGGEWAAATAYGSKDLPPAGVVALVSGLIGVAAACVLVRIGTLAVRLPTPMLRWGPWALVAVFALAGLGNLAAPAGSYAREWHIGFFGPLLLVVAILCVLVARSPLPDARRP